MVVLQFIGQGAFAIASLVLGIKLLALWRRTREVPELGVGLSFLLGGGVGYLSWFVLGFLVMQGSDVAVVRSVVLIGLAASVLGSVANGVGTAAIYRPGRTWPRLYVGAVGVGMVGGWIALARAPIDGEGYEFWFSILLSALIYGWAAGEALLLARVLHRRARLGMADPLVVNRTGQWAVASIAIVGMIVLSFASRLAHGPVAPAWVPATSALLGLGAAASIWLGFFPPQALRRHLGRVYAS